MKTATLPLLALVMSVLANSLYAKTHVEASGDVYHEQKIVRKFNIGGEGKQKLRLTMGCVSNKAGSGTMRVYFYRRSPQGGWDQMEQLRVQINGSRKETSDTFFLPPGEYQCQIKVRRVKYTFKLEDA